MNQLREFAAEARALESDHGELIRQRLALRHVNIDRRQHRLEALHRPGFRSVPQRLLAITESAERCPCPQLSGPFFHEVPDLHVEVLAMATSS